MNTPATLALGCALASVATPAALSAAGVPALHPAHASGSANPILPGYYADPSLVTYQDKYYVYATLDPWGGATLGCWESADFANWTYRPLNWPTKAACTSPTSKSSSVWAPSVVRAPDGRFVMYVSVGSEVWAGVAEHPLGPWTDALGGRPLIPGDYRPGYHMIDAEVFLDDDGTPYLYWGSGWNWVNGRCWAVRLKPDLLTFDGEVRDVTPANYFEAPFMFKRGGRYYLTYSHGRTDEDTYQVRYAVGDSPFGPFVEPANSPVLFTDRANDVVSPGHHAIFSRAGRDYILYHRHSVPHDPKFIGRQLCVDELAYTAEGLIERVVATHAGPEWLRGLRSTRDGRPNLATPARGALAMASGRRDAFTGAERVMDDNYATAWVAPRASGEAATGAWLRLDLGTERALVRQEIRFEYAWKPVRFTLEASTDGETWITLRTPAGDSPVGSPLILEGAVKARYLRLTFSSVASGSDGAAVIDWSVF